MDSLLKRNSSMFFEATGNLFTDEKIASARAKIIEWCNELPTAKSQKKCDLLAKIQEVALSSCVEHVEEFLESILSLAHDQNADVRRQIMVFIEECCRKRVELLPQLINTVSMLLRDKSAVVIKRTIQSSSSIYKNGLQWLCGQRDPSEDAESAWNVLGVIKAQILDMIDSDNEGIRTNALKFLEGIVLLESYADEDSQKRDNDFSLDNVPETHRLIKRQKLENEGYDIFKVLLHFHNSAHITPSDLTTANSRICSIAKLRPRFMGPVIDACHEFTHNPPTTLSDSQLNSARRSLKVQLSLLLKNRGAFEFQSKLRSLLLNLGASSSEIHRLIPKIDKQEQLRRQKRIIEQGHSIFNKRQKLTEEMVVDEDELERQKDNCMRLNEKCLLEQLRSKEATVELVMMSLPRVPAEAPEQFLKDYMPITHISIQQQTATIARLLAIQMTAKKVGPGASAYSRELPMRPKAAVELDDEDMDYEDDGASSTKRRAVDDDFGEQETSAVNRGAPPRAPQTQGITVRPLNRDLRERLQFDAITRILKAEQVGVHFGKAVHHRRLVTVLAATFPDRVRELIIEFIKQNLKARLDLALTWLFEEYSLARGYTRHSYVKTENHPEFAYNQLLLEFLRLINDTYDNDDKTKRLALRRLYLEAPLLPLEAIAFVEDLCVSEERNVYLLSLLKDVYLLRVQRRVPIMRIYTNFSLHERPDLRAAAIQQLLELHRTLPPVAELIDTQALARLQYLEQERPPAELFAVESGRPSAENAWNEDLAKVCIALPFALLPLKPELYFERLTQVYVATTADMKRTILRSLDAPIKCLGMENRVLLDFIARCVRGTEMLVIRCLYLLNDGVPKPSDELMNCVRSLYANKLKDVRVLIPVLHGLSRQELITTLPKIIKLNNHAVTRETFNRLLGLGNEYAQQTVALKPDELLITLHTIEPTECDYKHTISATTMCMMERQIFTADVLTKVLQKLMSIDPLPTLTMRTMIQSVTNYPTMTPFILELMQELIYKQVWQQKLVWVGFMRCIERLTPKSFSVLLQLPAPTLSKALEEYPKLREPLRLHAERLAEEPMTCISQQIIDIIHGKAVDVFVTDDSGGYMILENIKKEVVESYEPKFNPDSNQPLPPGED